MLNPKVWLAIFRKNEIENHILSLELLKKE